MSEITIRRATPEDAMLLAKLCETVQSLHEKARPDFFKTWSCEQDLVGFYREAIERESNYIFIAEIDKDAVGFALAMVITRPESVFTHEISSVFVDQFCVVDGQQKRGYGSALMEAVFELARDQNIKRIALDVWDFNEQALEFYRKRGFVPFMQRLETHLD